MKPVVRGCGYVLLAMYVLTASAVAQSSERLTLSVTAPVRMGERMLSPGAYELVGTDVRTVLTLEEKKASRGRVFVQALATSQQSTHSNRATVEVAPNPSGAAAISAIYFPQSQTTYFFRVAPAKVANEVRAAIK